MIDRPPYGSAPRRLVDLTDEPEPAASALIDLDGPQFGGPKPDDPDEDPDPEDLDEDPDEDDGADFVDDQAGDLPAPITPEQHANCPGHAAYLTTTYGGPQRRPQAVAVHVCTDPLGTGTACGSGRRWSARPRRAAVHAPGRPSNRPPSPRPRRRPRRRPRSRPRASA